MKNYYQILEVSPDANQNIIRSSFRKKVKQLHPDVQAGELTRENDILNLLEAYEVLSDETTREVYDRSYRLIYGFSDDFDYREFLESRADDIDSQSKLVCYDLLHNNDEDALALYEDLCEENDDFFLGDYLDREDFMDFSFLIAELFVHRKHFGKAFPLLRSIILYELQKPYFKHFFVDVMDLAKKALAHKLPGDDSNDLRLKFLQELISYELPVQDIAFFNKTIAEIYVESEQPEVAKYYLEHALKLHGKIPGIARIKKKVGL